MIKFNDKETAAERHKTKPLTLKQEIEVVSILNERLHGITKDDLQKVQKLFDHYQNLCHFRAAVTGLWASDGKPFQIT